MGRLGSDLASCCYVSGKRKRGATRNKTSGTTCFAFVDSSPHASPVCRLGLVGQIGPPLLVTQVCPKKTDSAQLPSVYNHSRHHDLSSRLFWGVEAAHEAL